MNNNFAQDKEIETKLLILQDILGKKQDALVDLLNISENQELLYQSPPSDERREFLLEMGKQKQSLIDIVLDCDEVFQKIFEGFATEFDDVAKVYPVEVKNLKDAITTVLEIDVKIRAQEEKSKDKAIKSIGKPSVKANINPANTGYMIEKYKQHSKLPKGNASAL